MIAKYKRTPMPFWLRQTLDYLYVLIGAFLVAIAFNLFLLPNNIASGGVAGVSTITKSLFDWEPSIVQWALNIPLFIAGVVILGKNFGAKSLVGTIILPFYVYLTKDMEPATSDPLLGAIFGGMIVGLGIGIVFRGKASTGGMDLAAQLLHTYTSMPLGVCLIFFDGMIVLTASFVFSLEEGLYAIIGLFITSRTIDFVQVGLNTSKNVMIITNQFEEVRRILLNDIDRGVTIFNGSGGFTDEDRKVIMCVVQQNEFSKATQAVKSIDPNAFVIVMNATEVLGEGFKK
ncbi:YitT family protein [Gracilibacillus caseinilyticus]|uniref:YitT family protein n=1 Tax=Gracilibacillus caseinilyticus TaxID=2932256 RepID=A0ABY4EV34_9BACI|nr:YitT family protein [Gracilibacillus caseinilyticus]UOQ48277.1 YitT family protein [Gracilibacillus caseinilyticus]